jgi:RNA polymerase sigma-70 factor, ECF subfamily
MAGVSENQGALVALVRRAQAGDRDACARLFEDHQRALTGYCLMAVGGDRDRALDLTQEVFARAFQRLDTLAEPSRFRCWLFAIAANLCRNRGVEEVRRREILDAADLALDIDPSAQEDKMLRERRISAVQRILARVDDPTLRRIVTMKYLDPEHTTREISEHLAIPRGTVTVQLMRFRAAAQRMLIAALAEVEGGTP